MAETGFSPDRQTARGGAWMIFMRWAMRGIGLVSTLILARLLDPGDFGVIAMAMIVVGFLELLSNVGVDLALLRLESPSRADYDSGWTLQLIISAGLALVIFSAAVPASLIFDEAKLVPVVQALAFRSLFNGFNNIGTVEFRRHFDFAREFRYSLYKKMAGFVITITAAVILRSYWALVIGMTVGVFAHVVISYVMHPYRPRLCVGRIGQLWRFSLGMVGLQMVRFGNRRIDQFLVGNLAGTSDMGSYHIGYELATIPTNELVMPMARGVFPSYARLQHSPEALFAAYCKTLSAIALLCTPIGFGLAAVADPAVPLVIGEKWAQTVPIIEALAVFGVFFALATTIEPVMQATGRVRLFALTGLAQLAALGAVLYWAGHAFGIEAVAPTRVGFAALYLPVAFFLVKVATGLSLRYVLAAALSAIWPRFAAGAVMVAAVEGLHLSSLQAGWALVIDILLGAAVYTGVTMAIWLLRGRPEGLETAALRWGSAQIERGRPFFGRSGP